MKKIHLSTIKFLFRIQFNEFKKVLVILGYLIKHTVDILGGQNKTTTLTTFFGKLSSLK